MRENDSVIEELQPEEILPDEEMIQEQPSETDAEIVPEAEERPQDVQETEQPAEEVAEETEPVVAEKAPAIPEVTQIPYHERYYLKYREGKRNTPLDLDGTKAFLQQLGFDGGELRQAREGKDCAESYRNADKNKNNQMYCSYCGTEIAGVEFFRLPDGRMRCTTCSSTVVKTKAEVEELSKKIVSGEIKVVTTR
jgi:hypothetical protein